MKVPKPPADVRVIAGVWWRREEGSAFWSADGMPAHVSAIVGFHPTEKTWGWVVFHPGARTAMRRLRGFTAFDYAMRPCVKFLRQIGAVK